MTSRPAGRDPQGSRGRPRSTRTLGGGLRPPFRTSPQGQIAAAKPALESVDAVARGFPERLLGIPSRDGPPASMPPREREGSFRSRRPLVVHENAKTRLGRSGHFHDGGGAALVELNH